MDGLKRILLEKIKYYEVCYKGMLVSICFDEKRNKMELKTLIFSEKNYIPTTVRDCVKKVFKSSKDKKFPAYLDIDEKIFSIYFVQEIKGIVKIPVSKLVKLFVFAARSWAFVLKHVAKHDLKNL